MEHTELEVVEQQVTGLSANVFSDPKAFQGLMRIATQFASSGIVPDQYKGKPIDCAIAIDMANRMGEGISPIFVMQNLYIVKGKPSWSGQACMSMINGSKKYKNVRPVYTGEKMTNSWGCHIEAENVKTGEIIKGTEITIAIAKAEGWYDKPGSKWKTLPQQMLAYRAAAFFARVYIPNALMGCAVENEGDDIASQKTAPEIKNVFGGVASDSDK